MYGLLRGRVPAEHLTVKRGERVARIHDEHHSMERGAGLQVSADQLPPMIAYIGRNPGVPIAWKIHEKTASSKLIEIDMLCAARGFTDEGKASLPRKRIDRARFACVRT